MAITKETNPHPKVVTPASPGPAAAGHSETNRQIRGSSLLVVGRLMSVLLACVTQIITVHYLTKSQYGAFEYALSVVAVGETFITFGMDRTVARFIPMYQELGDRPRLLGTLLMSVCTVISLGCASTLVYYGVHSWVSHTLIHDQTAAALLLIMVLLAPMQRDVVKEHPTGPPQAAPKPAAP